LSAGKALSKPSEKAVDAPNGPTSGTSLVCVPPLPFEFDKLLPRAKPDRPTKSNINIIPDTAFLSKTVHYPLSIKL
jgi:hypothetical protein